MTLLVESCPACTHPRCSSCEVHKQTKWKQRQNKHSSISSSRRACQPQQHSFSLHHIGETGFLSLVCEKIPQFSLSHNTLSMATRNVAISTSGGYCSLSSISTGTIILCNARHLSSIYQTKCPSNFVHRRYPCVYLHDYAFTLVSFPCAPKNLLLFSYFDLDWVRILHY